MKGGTKISILDTTLRDGEQTPGFSFSNRMKIRVAELLDRLGVDVIDIGFPKAYRDDAKCLRALSKKGLKSKLAVIARARREEIDLAADNGANRIILIVPASGMLLKNWINKSRQDTIRLMIDATEYGIQRGIGVEVSMVDAFRTPLPQLQEFVKALPRVDCFTIADTVGSASPKIVRNYVLSLYSKTRCLGVHFHNDMGLATANTLEAISAGAKEVHTSISGIGERAGNASFEQVAVGIKQTLNDLYSTDLKLDILYSTILEISRTLGINICENSPIIGKNVFTHEVDIHVLGMLLDEKSFEPFSPKIIGRESSIVFGKFSGKRSLELFLEKNRLKLGDKKLETLVSDIKSKTLHGGFITEEEVLRIANRLRPAS